MTFVNGADLLQDALEPYASRLASSCNCQSQRLQAYCCQLCLVCDHGYDDLGRAWGSCQQIQEICLVLRFVG